MAALPVSGAGAGPAACSPGTGAPHLRRNPANGGASDLALGCEKFKSCLLRGRQYINQIYFGLVGPAQVWRSNLSLQRASGALWARALDLAFGRKVQEHLGGDQKHTECCGRLAFAGFLPRAFT